MFPSLCSSQGSWGGGGRRGGAGGGSNGALFSGCLWGCLIHCFGEAPDCSSRYVRTYVYVYRMFSVYWRKYQHAVYTTTILVSSDIRTCSFSVRDMPIDMYEHARTYVAKS